MTTLDHIVGEFAEAWKAGRRPDVGEYLARVGASEREELAARLGDWLAIAPTPEYDDATLAAIRAEPALRAALDAGVEPLPARLSALRERAGLGVRELAQRLVALFGLDDEERATDYIERLERRELDETRLSRRLVTALASIVRVDPDQLMPAPPRPAMGTAFMRASKVSSQRWKQSDIEMLSQLAASPAPEPMDELDRLFLGGPEG